jgi:hypothetical protein
VRTPSLGVSASPPVFPACGAMVVVIRFGRTARRRRRRL